MSGFLNPPPSPIILGHNSNGSSDSAPHAPPTAFISQYNYSQTTSQPLPEPIPFVVSTTQPVLKPENTVSVLFFV